MKLQYVILIWFILEILGRLFVPVAFKVPYNVFFIICAWYLYEAHDKKRKADQEFDDWLK